jgi:hypothetical protein
LHISLENTLIQHSTSLEIWYFKKKSLI